MSTTIDRRMPAGSCVGACAIACALFGTRVGDQAAAQAAQHAGFARRRGKARRSRESRKPDQLRSIFGPDGPGVDRPRSRHRQPDARFRRCWRAVASGGAHGKTLVIGNGGLASRCR